MATFESTKSFADVPITADGVDTPQFLEASDGLVNLFDLLGSAIFGFVQMDLRQNITGVRTRYDSHTAESRTLEAMVLAEQAEGKKDATICLGRLLRGLAFTMRALQQMQTQPDTPLTQCFRQAYDATLGHHHAFLVRKVVGVAILAVPARPDFYARISQSAPSDTARHAQLDIELRKWLDALERICAHMKVFLEERNITKVTM